MVGGHLLFFSLFFIVAHPIQGESVQTSTSYQENWLTARLGVGVSRFEHFKFGIMYTCTLTCTEVTTVLSGAYMCRTIFCTSRREVWRFGDVFTQAWHSHVAGERTLGHCSSNNISIQ